MLVTLILSPLLAMALTITYRVAAVDEDNLHVDYSRQGLTSLANVTWPEGVTSLHLGYNRLRTLTSWNSLDVTCLRRLDLSHNLLENVTNDSFRGMGQLQWLSLSDNQLKTLQVDSFADLGELTYLDLSQNRLIMDDTSLPQNLFRSLHKLNKLDLRRNDPDPDGSYPSNMLAGLTHLKVLAIGVFYKVFFPPGFASLRSLKTLSLSTNDEVGSLRNRSFEAFRNSSLTELTIGRHGKIHHFITEACTFCPLRHLKILRLDLGGVTVVSLLPALYGLQYLNMSVIDFYGCKPPYSITIDRSSARYLRNICVSKLSFKNTNLERLAYNAITDADSPLSQCIEHIDLSSNRFIGDFAAVFKMWLRYKRLRKFELQNQKIFSLESAGCLLGREESCKDTSDKEHGFSLRVPISRTLVYMNLSSSIPRFGALPDHLGFTRNNLRCLDLSYSQMSNCISRFENMDALETLALNGNNCYNVSENLFDCLPSLRHLHLSNFNVDPEFFREHARRMFKNLDQLETLDLSLNSLVHLDPHMMTSQRRLKELNLAGNHLQSMALNLAANEQLRVLDLSHNMLPTLTSRERESLDHIQANNNLSLRLFGNPFLCGCSNLDFMTWLTMTSIQLDGKGMAYNYTCVTDTGEVSSTAEVIGNHDLHWRRCVGASALGVAVALFLLLTVAMLTSWTVVRSWTHLCYLFKVMRKARLPRREEFRKDVYVGYADTDADCDMACMTLPRCLTERHNVTLLLRHEEEIPGCVRAETIVEHMDDCWKILLLVTPDFAQDEFLCGFTVHQAQRSITDSMPNRVVVLFLEHPHRLPPMPSLEKLLRMVPERNVLHMQRDTPPHHHDWQHLAELILEA